MQAFNAAIKAWQALLGSTRVLSGAHTLAQYQEDTFPLYNPQAVQAVLLPKDVAEIQALVNIANTHKVALYPISRGRNWGYGSKRPPRGPVAIIDMGALNAISQYDEVLGSVWVQPGVTPGMLYTFLKQKGNHFMVPVTGAGPDTSILGNVLERGYGITPYADHFNAMIGLEAVLPDGSLYQSPLQSLQGHAAASVYKWGIGPYTDGLFAQGNFGIVTGMRVSLATRPSKLLAFIFSFEHIDLPSVIRGIRALLATAGGNLGGLNLMNKARVLSMIRKDGKGLHGFTDPVVLEALGKQHRVADWTLTGAIYGEGPVVWGVKRLLIRYMGHIAVKKQFLRAPLINRALHLVKKLPGKMKKRLQPKLETVQLALGNMAGEPNAVALSLAYRHSGEWRQGEQNPAKDGSGLIWYAPIIPIEHDSVLLFHDRFKVICEKHGIEPLLTYTTVNERAFSATIPILFNKYDDRQAFRAKACYEELLAMSQETGMLPYRLGVDSMENLKKWGKAHFEKVQALKRAWDPNSILAPGRYDGTV